jgi:hypothetical protein
MYLVCPFAPWHTLNFWPLPHGQSSLRPTFLPLADVWPFVLVGSAGNGWPGVWTVMWLMTVSTWMSGTWLFDLACMTSDTTYKSKEYCSTNCRVKRWQRDKKNRKA